MMMARFVQGSAKMSSLLVKCCINVANDGNADLRAAFAHEFPKIIPELNSKACNVRLKTIVQVLLKDSDSRVRVETLRHLSKIVGGLQTENAQWDATELRAVLIVATSAMAVDGDETAKNDYIAQLSAIPAKLLGYGTHRIIVPSLLDMYKCATSDAARASAAKGIVTVSRSVSSPAKRDEYLEDMWRELGQSSYNDRMIIVECVEAALEVYSDELFEELFWKLVFELAKDPAASVRLRLATAMPRLAPLCQRFEGFEDVLRALRSDEDDQVQRCMESFVPNASACVQEFLKKANTRRKRRVAECNFFTPRKAPQAVDSATDRQSSVMSAIVSFGSKLTSLSWSAHNIAEEGKAAKNQPGHVHNSVVVLEETREGQTFHPSHVMSEISSDVSIRAGAAQESGRTGAGRGVDRKASNGLSVSNGSTIDAGDSKEYSASGKICPQDQKVARSSGERSALTKARGAHAAVHEKHKEAVARADGSSTKRSFLSRFVARVRRIAAVYK